MEGKERGSSGDGGNALGLGVCKMEWNFFSSPFKFLLFLLASYPELFLLIVVVGVVMVVAAPATAASVGVWVSCCCCC